MQSTVRQHTQKIRVNTPGKPAERTTAGWRRQQLPSSQSRQAAPHPHAAPPRLLPPSHSHLGGMAALQYCVLPLLLRHHRPRPLQASNTITPPQSCMCCVPKSVLCYKGKIQPYIQGHATVLKGYTIVREQEEGERRE